MEDCNSQDLLEWIAASRKLKLSDTTILNNLTEMLENISKDTKVRMAVAQQQTAQQTAK
jgi:hypothetical protein